MNQDIKIKSNNYKFKYRVSGILIKNNKLLTVQMNNNGFYCLPGGHVEIMEKSSDAIIREYYEETKMQVNIEKLLYITENFFDGNLGKCHELGMYYLLSCKDIKQEDYTRIEHDKDGDIKLEFKWLDINHLDDFKPEFIKTEILNIDKDRQINHFIIENRDKKS